MIRKISLFLCLFFLISCQAFPDLREESPPSKPPKDSVVLKNYEFTSNWVFYNLPVWDKVLAPFKGKANIHYLEIGLFEGRSAIWMLENILTHPTARLTGIDIFPMDLKERYLSNLKLSGFEHKATTIEGYSQVELRKLPLNSFDIIYIDGCHRADCTLSDAVLSFELLKDGGILIFDDYKWREDDFPVEKRPQTAIDSFITAYRNYIAVLHHAYQVVLKKRNDPSAYCESLKLSPGCSPIGQYSYVWKWKGKKGELYSQDMSEKIYLSDEEMRLIERLARSTKFGKTEWYLDCTLLENKEFMQLKERLQLDLNNIKVDGEGDGDDDGVCAVFDNCPEMPNRDQRDNDSDGMGDLCDPDDDNDTIVDNDDNCPFLSNPDQRDSYPPQGNTIGDVCDCEGDFNCDGSVSSVDLQLFKKSQVENMLLTNPCTNENQCKGDFNCNGKIDEEDEMLFKSDLGRSQHNNPCPACVVGDWCVYP